MVEMVCDEDGVALGQGGDGRWLHTDALPEGVDYEHEVRPVTLAAREARVGAARSLRQAAEEMLLHHATIHPASDCPFYGRLLAAARRPA